MDLVLLIVPGVIWGASFLFIAEGLEAMGPNGVTFTRILVGFLVLALFPGSRRAVGREDEKPHQDAGEGHPVGAHRLQALGDEEKRRSPDHSGHDEQDQVH